MRALARRFGTAAATLATAVGTVIGPDEVLLWLGLTLLGTGAWLMWPPAGLMLPGLVLLWIHLPTRRVFVARPPTIVKKGRRA